MSFPLGRGGRGYAGSFLFLGAAMALLRPELRAVGLSLGAVGGLGFWISVGTEVTVTEDGIVVTFVRRLPPRRVVIRTASLPGPLRLDAYAGRAGGIVLSAGTDVRIADGGDEVVDGALALVRQGARLEWSERFASLCGDAHLARIRRITTSAPPIDPSE